MSTVAVICPKCQQQVQAYLIEFSDGRTVVTLLKCSSCAYEWRETPAPSPKTN